MLLMISNQVIFWIVLIVVVAVVVIVKDRIDTKKGYDSPEKAAIKELAAKMVSNNEQFTTAYAYWEISKYLGKTKTTEYWYYAIAFGGEELHVIPLSFEGGDMTYGTPEKYTSENLGMVDSSGYVINLFDKEGNWILDFMVMPDNTKLDKYHPVNIQQKEEADKFETFAKGFMKTVNDANGIPADEKDGRPKGRKKSLLSLDKRKK